MCRLFQHSTFEAGVSALADELIAEAQHLCRHKFAHHVIQAILEHGSSSQKRQIADALRGKIHLFALDRNASYVVETALLHCDKNDQDALATGLVSGGPERIAHLAKSECGAHVLRSLLKMPGEHLQRIIDGLQAAATLIQSTRFGQRFLEDFRPCSAVAMGVPVDPHAVVVAGASAA